MSFLKSITSFILKKLSPIFFNFFPNFLRFWYHMKAHIFLTTHGKFHHWKVFHLKDINENVSSYGNHNKAYTVRYRQLHHTKLLCTSKQLDHFNWNFKFTTLVWFSSNEREIQILKNRTMPFKEVCLFVCLFAFCFWLLFSNLSKFGIKIWK